MFVIVFSMSRSSSSLKTPRSRRKRTCRTTWRGWTHIHANWSWKSRTLLIRVSTYSFSYSLSHTVPPSMHFFYDRFSYPSNSGIFLIISCCTMFTMKVLSRNTSLVLLLWLGDMTIRYWHHCLVAALVSAFITWMRLTITNSCFLLSVV